eukprot:15364439-Ditylum_brightwellii.AAC.6
MPFPPPNNKGSISDTVKQQLQFFRADKAHELLDSAYTVKPLTPGKNQQRLQPTPSCQMLLLKELHIESAPPALYNNDLYVTVLDSYPQQGAGGIPPKVTQQEQDCISKLQKYPDDKLIQLFTAITPGKGGGPFGDTTNIFRNLTIHTLSFGKSTPYLRTVWSFMLIFAANTYLNKLFEEFSSVWLILLFKKWPITEEADIRYHPIEAGTGLQRCISASLLKSV